MPTSTCIRDDCFLNDAVRHFTSYYNLLDKMMTNPGEMS
ncbi:hypothetical protein HPTD01_1244 [Halomonas sp. TD01]|nr:hypothetical protein HPTD01_1244 [Halomonas sp. TD01]